jgi:hypothetical protein
MFAEMISSTTFALPLRKQGAGTAGLSRLKRGSKAGHSVLPEYNKQGRQKKVRDALRKFRANVH